MLKVYFNTGNGLVNRGVSRKSVAIPPRLWIHIFLIVIFSLSCLFAIRDFAFAYSLLQPPDTPDGDITTGNTHYYNYAYRPVVEGQPIEFTISATDPDGDPLTFSASNLPEGASFDAATATFSWTPRYDQAGVYVVRFEVSDGVLSDFEDVTITVIQLYQDWDVNGDAAANILDMILVGQHWDETGLTGWIREDANEDGTISVLDMIVVGQNWTG
jgi:hypothetical protein